MSCTNCGGTTPESHEDEHPGLCCDCFDLSLGMPLDQLNDERKAKGRPPLRPWKCDRWLAFDQQQQSAGGTARDLGRCDWGTMTIEDIAAQAEARGATECIAHAPLARN